MAGVRFGEVIGKHLRALPLTLSLSHMGEGTVNCTLRAPFRRPFSHWEKDRMRGDALRYITPVHHPMSAPAASVAAADWFLWPGTQAVFACLNREGFEARVVGGAVRNALLGLPVTEVDFATTAKPEDVTRLAAQAGIKTVPTGIAHGTVTLIAGGVPFEVTSLRRDVETDGRHATVAFGTDWADDARRRDFTMNALYADAQGKVHDPLGGLSDLRGGRVRFVGDPAQRIREDYLRTLRFFRFSAGYAAGAFDPDGITAAIRERMGLLRLSRERVRTELLRILVAPRAGEAIEIMEDTGPAPPAARRHRAARALRAALPDRGRA